MQHSARQISAANKSQLPRSQLSLTIRIGMLECGICLDEIQEPRALDCLHSFCFKCLTGLLSADQGLLQCPQCRRLTRKRPTELERDFRIEQLKEMKPLVIRGLEQLSAEATTRASEILASVIEERHLSQVIDECDRQLAMSEADEAAFSETFRRHLRQWQEAVVQQQAEVCEKIDRRKQQLQLRRRWAAEAMEARAAAQEVLARVRRGDHEGVRGLLDRLGPPAESAPPLTEPRVPASERSLRAARERMAETALKLLREGGRGLQLEDE